jgi:CTP synthase
LDGVVVPGGFGSRGIEGKILTSKFCRENNIPYFGLCYGMQIAVIDYARHVAGLEGANSEEMVADCKHPVIHIMLEQKDFLKQKNYGGSMRLGSYPCNIRKETLTYEAYQGELIHERHRHRYEFNNEYRKLLKEKGLCLSGLSPDDKLVEIVEIPGHKFFVGTQFHPEFKSRPLRAHPLFKDFIKASNKHALRKS